MNEGDWQQLAGMAAEHRLQSLLHGIATRGEFAAEAAPANIRANWQAAAREQFIAYLLQRKALREAAQLLDPGGLLPVALKGAWLSSNVERPLSGGDLLLFDALLPAWRLLHTTGWSGPDLAFTRREMFGSHECRRPPLWSAERVMLELHGTLPDPADTRVDAGPLARGRRPDPPPVARRHAGGPV